MADLYKYQKDDAKKDGDTSKDRNNTSGYDVLSRSQNENRADSIRTTISGNSEAQRVNKVFGQFTQKNRDAVKAIDSEINLKEQDAEMYDERAKQSTKP